MALKNLVECDGCGNEIKAESGSERITINNLAYTRFVDRGVTDDGTVVPLDEGKSATRSELMADEARIGDLDFCSLGCLQKHLPKRLNEQHKAASERNETILREAWNSRG